MSGPPELHEAALVHLVDGVFARDSSRRSNLLAVLGTGAPRLLRTQAGEFEVVPVRSEVELRRALPPLDLDPAEAAEIRKLFLVPWDALPLDISGRFAGHGRVLTMPRMSLLRAQLGADEVDPAVLESPLADFLVQQPGKTRLRAMGRLTDAILWQAWLEAEWGTPRDLNVPAMLAWAATDGRGPGFVQAMGAAEAKGVQGELHRFLGQQVGALGPILWRAWERGEGRQLLAFAVLCEALDEATDEGALLWLEMVSKGPLGDARLLADVQEQLRGRVALALSTIEAEGDAALLAVLRAAETIIAEAPAKIRPRLIGSPRLETSWNLRLEAVGEAITALLKRRDQAALAEVGERLRTLTAHERIKKPDAAAIARQAEMGARLAAWLVDRSDRRIHETHSSYAAAEALARWYTEEGGYIDRARRAARPAAVRPDRFGKAIAAVLQGADELRRALDLRFAGALAEWYAARRPTAQVLPIDRAVDRFVVDFLKVDERRLLVLLLDGMAWAQAVELLESLAQRATPWAPIAWMARRVGDGPFPPILAAAPTLTQISRSAFFAGKLMASGKDHQTTDDPARWAKHSGLKKLIPGVQAPRLHLGAAGHNRDGSLAPAVREQIERGDERVVALVLNAIDDSLGADPQQEHTWRVDAIRSLPDLLEAARASGRAVLLASDHGHIAGDRLQRAPVASTKGGSRWRWLDSHGVDPAYEVAFRGDDVWIPRGAEGIVMLADDQHSYSTQRTWGEHGGATLAEVVAPLLLLGWEGMDRELREDDADKTYALRHVSRPAWWHLELRDDKRGKAKPAGKAAKAESAAPIAEQALLSAPGFELPPPPTATPATEPKASTRRRAAGEATTATATATATAPAPVLSRTTQALAKSPEFKGLTDGNKYRDQVLLAVDYLLTRQGLASLSAFADALGIQEWRVTQTISRYTELLNLDGEPILHYDLRAQQVRLDRDRLALVFGIEIG